MVRHRSRLRTTAAALYPGTTVRYHYRSGDDLATVVDRTDGFVTFVGEECDGKFTEDQIDRLIDDGRLQVVLDDETHVPAEGRVEQPNENAGERTR